MAMHKYPMTKNKVRILTSYNTKNITIQNDPKVMLSDKLDSIINKISRIDTNINTGNITIDTRLPVTNRKYNKFTIVKDNNNNVHISKKDNVDRFSFNDTENWVQINPHLENRCIIKNTYNNGNHLYDLNGKYSLNDISQMLERDDYYGYIHNGDWVELETESWKFKFIININTYRNSNPNTHDNPNNMDLICVECTARSGKTSDIVPWGINKPIIPQIYDNPKIPNGYTPIILGKFTNDLWDNFINPLVLLTNNKGFGNVFLSHIIDKYKSTIGRNFNKTDMKSNTNITDAGIYDNANLGKVWFLYESEIIDSYVYSTVIEGMLCEQYPMFKHGKYRKFIFNGQECAIMTSTIKNGTFTPVYINKGFSNQTRPEYMYFPMFGMRFI